MNRASPSRSVSNTRLRKVSSLKVAQAASAEAGSLSKASRRSRSAPSSALEFSLPERPNEWLPAKGLVAWVCPKADQYTFSPGMGVRFTEINPDIRNRVLELVKSFQPVGQPAA